MEKWQMRKILIFWQILQNFLARLLELSQAYVCKSINNTYMIQRKTACKAIHVTCIMPSFPTHCFTLPTLNWLNPHWHWHLNFPYWNDFALRFDLHYIDFTLATLTDLGRTDMTLPTLTDLDRWGDSLGPQLSASGHTGQCWPPSAVRLTMSLYLSLGSQPPWPWGLSYHSTPHRSTYQEPGIIRSLQKLNCISNIFLFFFS